MATRDQVQQRMRLYAAPAQEQEHKASSERKEPGPGPAPGPAPGPGPDDPLAVIFVHSECLTSQHLARFLQYHQAERLFTIVSVDQMPPEKVPAWIKQTPTVVVQPLLDLLTERPALEFVRDAVLGPAEGGRGGGYMDEDIELMDPRAGSAGGYDMAAEERPGSGSGAGSGPVTLESLLPLSSRAEVEVELEDEFTGTGAAFSEEVKRRLASYSRAGQGEEEEQPQQQQQQ